MAGSVVVGAALRFWGLQFGLPSPRARTDEEVIVDVALAVLHDPNPHFFDWPTLFMYVTGAAYAALFAFERVFGGAMRSAAVAKAFHLPTLHLTARVLSALAGTISIALLYGAARELLSRRAAALAAAFLAVAFLHARDSHFGVTDVPATMAMLAAFWAGLRCATRGSTAARLALAGLLCGLAASTKYNTAIVMLTPIVAVSADAWLEKESIGRIALLCALLLATFAVGFLAGTPFALLDASAFYQAVSNVRSHLGGGHVVMARGWTYHAGFTLRYGVGLPLLLAAAAGAGWIACDLSVEAALLLAVPVAYYAVLGSGHTVFARYMMPIVPFLCLTAASCVERLADAARRRLGLTHARNAVAFAAGALLAYPTFSQTVAFDRLMARTDSRVLGAEWIASHAPGGASIYQTGFGGAHLLPMPLDRYLAYSFDEERNRFEINGTPVSDVPDLLVVLESPLTAYSQVPDAIRAVAAQRYALAVVIDGVPPPDPPDVQYDLEDAFYAPYVGMDRAVRPGPTVRIFERLR